jgi:hypothetical protein
MQTKRWLIAVLIFFGSIILLQGMLLGWSLVRVYRSHATGFVIVHVPVLVLLLLGLLAYWLSGKLVKP